MCGYLKNNLKHHESINSNRWDTPNHKWHFYPSKKDGYRSKDVFPLITKRPENQNHISPAACKGDQLYDVFLRSEVLQSPVLQLQQLSDCNNWKPHNTDDIEHPPQHRSPGVVLTAKVHRNFPVLLFGFAGWTYLLNSWSVWNADCGPIILHARRPVNKGREGDQVKQVAENVELEEGVGSTALQVDEGFHKRMNEQILSTKLRKGRYDFALWCLILG